VRGGKKPGVKDHTETNVDVRDPVAGEEMRPTK